MHLYYEFTISGFCKLCKCCEVLKSVVVTVCIQRVCIIQWYYHNWQSHWQDHQAGTLFYTCTWLWCHGCECKLSKILLTLQCNHVLFYCQFDCEWIQRFYYEIRLASYITIVALLKRHNLMQMKMLSTVISVLDWILYYLYILLWLITILWNQNVNS